MELRQIEYVVGVVDHGGFTRAARALHVTQPALSEGIARLEGELGVALFDRVGRGARLSSAGVAFLEPARQILRDRVVLTTSIAAVIGVEAGHLDLVVLPTLAVDPLAAFVGAFRVTHPRVTLRIEQPEDTTAVTGRVRSGQAELALGALPVGEAGLVGEPLAEQEFVVIIPAASPLAGRKRITIEQLAGVPLVTTPPGTSMRRLVDAAFADAGLRPEIAVETEPREAIVPLVLAGAGASILPRSFAPAATASGAVTAVLTPPIRRTIGLIRREGPVSPAAAAFIETARELSR